MNGEGVTFVAMVAFGIVILLAIGTIGRLLDLRRRREDEALGLQSRVSDALMLEPGLSGLAVTASMHVPLWPRKPPTLEIVGRVTSTSWPPGSPGGPSPTVPPRCRSRTRSG